VTVRQPEIDRLTLEAEVWRREAEALIALAGPSPAARCLDACCGPLGALAALGAAAPDGEVVGVEADAEMADDARDEVARRGLRNVTVVTDDLLEYRPLRLFELVYMRFAPVSLGRPGKRMLEALRALCLPGGAVLLQEPFGAFHYAGAPSGALEKLLGLARDAHDNCPRGAEIDDAKISGLGPKERLFELELLEDRDAVEENPMQVRANKRPP